MKHPRQQSGFTLVEIAIVLVIVGLLLGAVLKGQELIFNSKVKSTFSLGKEISAAINAYQDRYKALPGDDAQASLRFPTANPVPTNGNNDQVVPFNSMNCGNGNGSENCQVFLHLRAGGFISGTGTTSVVTAFGGSTSIAQSAAFAPGTGNALALGLAQQTLTHKIGSAIDLGFDDGDPARGTFRCRNIAGYNMATLEVQLPDVCSIQL